MAVLPKYEVVLSTQQVVLPSQKVVHGLWLMVVQTQHVVLPMQKKWFHQHVTIHATKPLYEQ